MSSRWGKTHAGYTIPSSSSALCTALRAALLYHPTYSLQGGHHEESTCCWPLPRLLVGRYHFCVALNRVVCADGGGVSAVACPRVTINVVGPVACGGSCAQVRGGRGDGVAAVTDA